ncbi:nitroreductase [Thermoactinomyces daqus]|uniref:Nitroreductase n=1 Tax=Thermoactinomyces daqus TaxID=1329516 RepID=A0A7W1X801_9BACL|nr:MULTISPECIES: nitroreductase [Thermoactinomyces]MBA4541684.1 nitroreductase [Thermoactinomyces daqus]MBH8604025.1 nitroreductase [Thermoactinomyces sp. CICC 10522]
MSKSITLRSLTEVIRERRTVRQFRPDPVPLDVMKEILETANWAPFHKEKEPWRFLLVHGNRREEIIALSMKVYSHLPAPTLKAFETYLRTVPIYLFVIMEESEERQQWEDDLCATAALIQNIQLLAWEKGLGMVWKSYYGTDLGRAYPEELGLKPGEKLVGLLLMGYFDQAPKPKRRTPLSELLTIRGD